MPNISSKELKNIMSEYEPDMLTDNEDVYNFKQAIQSLQKSDQIIFCLYTELESERKVAELLGVSRSPIHKLIVDIRKQITDYLEKYDTN
jgi:DNA-directed RNA polymerase specialized sigma subunit